MFSLVAGIIFLMLGLSICTGDSVRAGFLKIGNFHLIVSISLRMSPVLRAMFIALFPISVFSC